MRHKIIAIKENARRYIDNWKNKGLLPEDIKLKKNNSLDVKI